MIVAHNDFVVFYTDKENYVVHESMKYIEEVLEPIGFIRIHKSYIVPVSKIESIDGNVLKAAGEEFPIGRTFRENLLKTIEPLKIG
jgi:DNA-binding LytR/AlgR family response regulator